MTVRAEQVGVLDSEVVALGALGEHGHPMNSLHPHLHSPVWRCWQATHLSALGASTGTNGIGASTASTSISGAPWESESAQVTFLT
ncbi:MAG: hypothetical protein KGN78_05760 [Actinomycetales bacterium]|nr:hypothetical protein [Actinomycetales bacterium]